MFSVKQQPFCYLDYLSPETQAFHGATVKILAAYVGLRGLSYEGTKQQEQKPGAVYEYKFNEWGLANSMKRLSILTTPTTVDNLSDIDNDSLTNTWQLKAERLETRRLRKFKHSWA